MKTALITGGAGFIGSHLCDFLIEKGFRVICMDNLITGNKKNIEHLSAAEKSEILGSKASGTTDVVSGTNSVGNKNFKFISHDASKHIAIDDPLDYVLHFASPASPVDYQKIPIQTLKAGSLGTHNTLGLALAKKAKYVLASTSEVYGDPLVNPQPESYWGNVNPIGVRGCYDESKRFAEALVMAYHRIHNVDVRIARIFNSILADQQVIIFNDSDIHIESIESYVNIIEKDCENGEIKHTIIVPCFDPITCKVLLREVSAVIKHEYAKDAFELSLAYGRNIKVTGDHSVFKMKDGKPTAIPVRELKKGDYVAILSKLPVIVKDIKSFDLLEYLISKLTDKELWDYSIHLDQLKSIISDKKRDIYEILKSSGRIKAKNFNNGIFCAFNKYRKQSFLPFYVYKKLNIQKIKDSKIRVYKSGAHIYLPSTIQVDDDILWLIGFYLAEGSSNYKKGKSYFISFSSDDYNLEKASKILKSKFNVHVIKRKAESNKSPAIYVHSKILYEIFENIFKIIRKNKNEEIRIPPWIFQLPLSKVKYFLEGYKDGDGTHSGKKLGKELCFDTKFNSFANDILMLLLRFGVVASFGEYKTTYKKKYGDRHFNFYRITICELSDFNILNWDKGVTQKLTARKTGDLVWAWIRNIKKIKTTKYVYDFSVPDTENFVAGNGVFCHNTYGPKMRKNDGRVVPNFIMQALNNKPITVYGDGKQTRSFCYVSDLIEGIYKLMMSDVNEPVNLGNPDEYTIKDFAGIVKELTKSKSKIIFEKLPIDDPHVRCPDISKAKKELGWEPKVKLEEGLRKTVEWFENKK